MSCLHKTKCEVNIELPAMFVFLVFQKRGLIKSCSSSEALSAYRISWHLSLTGARFESTLEV
jgi:hypothetical protein